MDELLQFGYNLDVLDSPLELEGLDFDWEIDALDLASLEPNIDDPFEAVAAEAAMIVQHPKDQDKDLSDAKNIDFHCCNSNIDRSGGVAPASNRSSMDNVSTTTTSEPTPAPAYCGSANNGNLIQPSPVGGIRCLESFSSSSISFPSQENEAIAGTFLSSDDSITNNISLVGCVMTPEPSVSPPKHCGVSTSTDVQEGDISPSSIAEAKRRRAIRKEMLILKRMHGGRLIHTSPVADVQVEQVSKIAQLLLGDGEKIVTQENHKKIVEQPQDSLVELSMKLSSSQGKIEESLLSFGTDKVKQIADATNPTATQEYQTVRSEALAMQSEEGCCVDGVSKKEATSCPEFISSNDTFTVAASACDCSSIKEESADAVSASKGSPDHLAELPSGTDPESRRQRRLIRNRLSAALHRQRKRETLDTQKQIIEAKDAMIAKLKSQASDVSTVSFYCKASSPPLYVACVSSW
jgi:hypothetical protein